MMLAIVHEYIQEYVIQKRSNDVVMILAKNDFFLTK